MSGVCEAWTVDRQTENSTSTFMNEATEKGKTQKKKMENQESCIVWGALLVVMRLSKVVGVAPVKFEKGKDGVRMSLSPYWGIWSYGLAFGLTTILTVSFIIDLQLPKQRSVRVSTQMACTIWVIDLVILLVITNVGTCGAMTRVKKMIASIKSINLIIKKLNNNQPFVQAERARCVFVITWVSGATLMCVCDIYTYLYEALYNENDKLVVSLNVFYYITVLTTLVLELQYIFMAMLIGTALSKINGVLTELLLDIDYKYARSSQENNTEVRNTSSLECLNLLQNLVTIMDRNSFINALPSSQSAHSSFSVYRLILAYTGICDIARQFYKSNGVLLIILLMSFLIHMVITPYYFISFLFSLEENTGTKFGKYLQFVWCIHHASKIAAFMEPGHRMYEEMDRTKILIGQLMTRVDLRNEPLTSELELFQRQIALNTVTCSPLGMCVLTRPLIATVLSGLTTYFVIIVQFKSQETDRI